MYAFVSLLCDLGPWDLEVQLLCVSQGIQLAVQQPPGSVGASERCQYGKAPLFVDDPIDQLASTWTPKQASVLR